MSFFSHLECPACSSTYPNGPTSLLCSCGSPLLVRYDLSAIGRTIGRDDLRGRRKDLWRYAEFLPVDDLSRVVTLGEGFTPMLPMGRLGRALGLPNLLLKDEGMNPTGTFKARGAAVGVTMARQNGFTAIGIPTAGNAGGAWAAYSARAGIACTVVMPGDAQPLNAFESAVAGAATYRVDGILPHAAAIIGAAAREKGWLDATTLKEPYRIEGKKTMGFEIAEQLDWQVPDAIIYPTGGGVGIIGIYKALQELQAVGWIEPGRFPKLVASQAEGCDPVVAAVQAGSDRCVAPEHPRTAAGGLRVPKPLGDRLILQAIYETGGTALSVSDDDMIAMMRRVAETEGLLICPEGASSVVTAARLLESGYLKEQDRVVILNTGTGLKYSGLIPTEVPVLPRDARL